MTKVLVVGGTGFIGPKIVHALRAQDREVRVLVRRPERATRVAGWGAEIVAGDVTDPASLHSAVEGCTDVIHLVAIIQGREAEFHRIMTEGTKHLVAAAQAAGVQRFTLMSAATADDPANHGIPYYAAKWAEET